MNLSETGKLVADRFRSHGWRLRRASIGKKNAIGRGMRVTVPRSLKTGFRVTIEHDVFVKLASADGRLVLEDFVFVGNHVEFDLTGQLIIGRNTMLAPGVFITDHGHGTGRNRLIREQQCLERLVTIGDDVWIGAKAVILPGVTLAPGTVVGAGAVVSRSTEPYQIVGGVPARVLGRRK